MTVFAVHYTYTDDSAGRDAHRADHSAFLRSLAADGIVLAAVNLPPSLVARSLPVRGAALEDLEKAPGISKTMARGIYDYFHPSG